MNISLNTPAYEANNTVHAINQKERINLFIEDLGNFGIGSERIKYELFHRFSKYILNDFLYIANGKGIKNIKTKCYPDWGLKSKQMQISAQNVLM